MIVDVSGPDASDLLRRAVEQFATTSGPEPYVSSGVAMAFVSVAGDELTGWCYGYHLPRPDGSSMAYLHSIDVDASHRRQGHGRALLDAFMTEAGRRQATKAFLTTGRDNAPARRLYESAGGELATQGPTENYWFDLSDSPT